MIDKSQKIIRDEKIKNRILYEDSHCLLINKIKGEALEKNEKSKNSLLLTELIKKEIDVSKLFVTHRLDVPTSGLVLMAKTGEALSFYNECFANGKIEKKYWAIVEKNQALDRLFKNSNNANEFNLLSHYLWVDGRINKSFASTFANPEKNAKKADLKWRLVGMGENYAFLEIDLVTGRHHQIRAQLAAEGIFIKGDLKYGAKRSEKEGGIRLHAASISFPLYNRRNQAEELKMLSAEPFFTDPLWEAFSQAYKNK